jgi:hypothetical protein
MPEFEIVRADSATLSVDALVNAVNRAVPADHGRAI